MSTFFILNLLFQENSPEERSEIGNLPKSSVRTRHRSKPIPIGSHHTVCGHEAMDLAKRLTEELASHTKPSGCYESNRSISPDNEPRSRSYDQRHPHQKERKGT